MTFDCQQNFSNLGYSVIYELFLQNITMLALTTNYGENKLKVIFLRLLWLPEFSMDWLCFKKLRRGPHKEHFKFDLMVLEEMHFEEVADNFYLAIMATEVLNGLGWKGPHKEYSC